MGTGAIRKWSQSPRWSAAGGDDLAAEEDTVAGRRTGELRRRLPVEVVVHPLLLQVPVELLLLFVTPVPVRRSLLNARDRDRGKRQSVRRHPGRNVLVMYSRGFGTGHLLVSVDVKSTAPSSQQPQPQYETEHPTLHRRSP
jgi:hypothetical protein